MEKIEIRLKNQNLKKKNSPAALIKASSGSLKGV